MTQAQSTLSASRNASELVAHIDKLTQEIQQLYCLDDMPWVVGYSGGKDSTAVLQLIWNALKNLPLEERTKRYHYRHSGRKSYRGILGQSFFRANESCCPTTKFTF